MNECANLTYYKKNRDLILNRAKYYHENDKKRLRGQARDEKTDIAIYLKKKIKDWKNIKKIIGRQKSLNIIVNKIAF